MDNTDAKPTDAGYQPETPFLIQNNLRAALAASHFELGEISVKLGELQGRRAIAKKAVEEATENAQDAQQELENARKSLEEKLSVQDGLRAMHDELLQHRESIL